jgi:hypothetical protein
MYTIIRSRSIVESSSVQKEKNSTISIDSTPSTTPNKKIKLIVETQELDEDNVDENI